MKKILFVLTTLSLSAFAKCCYCEACEKSFNTLPQDLTVISVLDLTDKDLNEITQGKYSNTAIEFSNKTTLPISFFLKGDLINLEKDNSGEITVQKTFYARFVKDGLTLSLDLVEWKPFLEFITGDISIALKVNDNQPSLIFGAKTNKRL